MPNPAGALYDDGLTFWDDGSTWDSAAAETPESGPFLSSDNHITLNSTTTMQPWEITKTRAIATLTVWTQHAPTLQIGGQDADALSDLIDGFEPLAQARAITRDDADAAYRAVQSNLLKLQVLGGRVPQIIEGQLSSDEGLMRDLRDVYKVRLVTQNKILERARRLHPLWLRADAALAAMTPPLPPITRPIQGTAHTAAMYLALLQGHTDLSRAMSDTEGVYDAALDALDDHEEECDDLIKRWYKVAKATFEPGSSAYAALESIPTEQGTPAPDPIEISTLTQGGEGGLLALVAYVPGGGDHATTRLIRWQVDGLDPGFDLSVPLDPSGNALGPFAVGQVVRVMTEVSNSSGTRNSAVRTITIEEPIG
jgi:hypothetical protein